jgi:hypothetical protein
MRRPVTYIIIVLSTIVAFGSCGKRPGYVISEDEMMDILYDIRLAQAIYSNNSQFYADSLKDALVSGVLEKYDITQAQLDTSLVWYADNIEQYRIINDSVTSRLRAKSNLLMEQKSKMDMKLSQQNYLIPPFFYLNEFTPTFRFDIDSVKIKTINLSSFLLSFDVQGLNPLQRADATVCFTYKDTLVRNSYDINKNMGYTIAKPQLPDSLLKSISGYIHLDKKIGMSGRVMLYNISYSDSTAVKNNSTFPLKKMDHPTDQPAEIEMVQPKENEPIKADTLKKIDPALTRKRITK